MLEVISFYSKQIWTQLGFQKMVRENINDAILPRSHIAQAQRYYSLFKEVVCWRKSDYISEEDQSKLPTFQKIASHLFYFWNEETSVINQDMMEKPLKRSNALFGYEFLIENHAAYNKNWMIVRARKQEKYLL